MISELKGKKILFISPSFFGYEKEIKRTLEDQGALVDYFDERPRNSFLTKALIRINRELLNTRIAKYYQDILEKIAGKDYDYVFVINLEAMSLDIVTKFRAQFKNARFILYMWDSIKNKKGAQKVYHIFDKVSSFDKKDAEFHGNIKFRPLFFIESYAGLRQQTTINFDVSFIGTAHSDRYTIAKKVKAIAEEKGLSTYFFMYLQSPIMFFRFKLINKHFKQASRKDFSYTSLSKDKTLEVIRSSAAILDIHHPAQSGLTMRTIEILGAGKKLLTTNADIVNYDFYMPENICVIDRNDPQIEEHFLTAPYQTINEELLYKYSLKGWLEEIFFA